MAVGPTPAEMVRAVPRIRRDPLRYLESVVEQYGDVVQFPMPRTPVFLLNDPDGVRRVLVERSRDYVKQTVQYRSLAAVTGSGLLTADGEPWRRHRRIAQPAFHHSAVDHVAAQSVSAANRLALSWRAGIASRSSTNQIDMLDPPSSAAVDIEAGVLQATLEVVGRTLFDADFAAGERIVTAVHEALDVVVKRAQTPLPQWWPGPSRRQLTRAIRTLDATCARVVAAHRRDRQNSTPATDLLGLLLAAQDAGELSAMQVRDELVTMVIAGHETVASALSWALALLASHPQAQDDVATEVRSITGTQRDLTRPDLPALRQTRSIIDEALRLYPPAWVLTRRATAADVVAGVPVPQDSVIIISPWLIHRRAASWPDPLLFHPARGGFDAPSSDYLPFGVGPRLCIGREFALTEATLILATLISHIRILPLRGKAPAVPPTHALVTIRPRGGLRREVQVRQRDPETNPLRS
ncbi:MAG: cytochrome P450 [Actinomycetota bacterium]